MAKQKGPNFITGTRDGFCYYQLDGQYYKRRKSSLSSKRVKRSPAFKLTMVYAGLMAQASKIASEVYRMLPEKKRKHALYRKMTGEAMQLLKESVAAEAISARLQQQYVMVKPVAVQKRKKVQLGSLCVTADGVLRSGPAEKFINCGRLQLWTGATLYLPERRENSPYPYAPCFTALIKSMDCG